MWRKLVMSWLVVLAVSAASGPATASACPMCKEANETDDRRPRAYMYSILFMLAVPATVFTGFGVGFYRLSKMTPQPLDSAEDSPSADDPQKNSPSV